LRCPLASGLAVKGHVVNNETGRSAQMKLTIGVMGASAIPNAQSEQLAIECGEWIARSGAVLITGATTGLPLAAARGAKSAGGTVIGFSPSFNLAHHQESGYPMESHDLILCTGLSSHGRNLINVRASQSLIFIGGSMGALNEFTIAYDENKIIGVLEGSGGFCDYLKSWMEHLAKPHNRSIIIYDRSPESLVMGIFNASRERYRNLGIQWTDEFRK